MAIFPKRILQEMLNQNAHFLSEKQLREHVNKLNKGCIYSLSTEWETVILNTFSKIGHVQYEQSFGGNRFADLFFKSKDEPNISFLADITTVSDRGYEEDNPVKAFVDETERILKKNGIKLGGMHYEIESIKGKRGMKLKIPPKGQFDIFFNSFEFTDFTARIKKNPIAQHALHFISKEAEVKLFYNPQSKYISLHHASYDTAHSIKNNPVYNTLKSKAEQLKKTGYGGILAIFICDGGCSILNSNFKDWQSYNLDSIISEFYRQYSSIRFILAFTVKEMPHTFFNIKRNKIVEAKLFSNPIFEIPQTLLDNLNKFVAHLPIPVNTVINAAHKVSNRLEKQGSSFYGGSTMTSKTIKISSRGLLELLSGRIEQKKFLQDHCFIPTSERPTDRNPFDLKLNEGKLISNIWVEKSVNNDDDWIVFEFGKTDPAIFRFINPSEK